MGTDVIPYLHLVPWLSVLLAHVVPAVFAVLAAIAAVQSVRWARRARRPSDPSAGGHVEVRGRVEPIGDGAPIVVRIHQRRAPDPHDTESLAWVETSRDMAAQPFLLHVPSGERIRVEADAGTTLIGPELETAESGQKTRVRVARLEPGTRVAVWCAIVQGNDPTASFRGAPAPVLAGPSLVVSTIALGATERSRAAFHALALAGTLVLGAASLPLLGVLWRTYAGETVRADVTRLRVIAPADTEDDASKRHLVRVRIAPGQEHALVAFNEEIWESDWLRLRRGDHVYARVVRGHPSATSLGRHATIAVGPVALALIALLLAIVLLIAARRHRSGWWEAGLVVERGHSPGS